MATTSIEKIESEIFTPALQQAAQEATDSGHSMNDIVFGAANAYIVMLLKLVGPEQAEKMLQDQARLLEEQLKTQAAE